jgi:hypothetical protein
VIQDLSRVDHPTRFKNYALKWNKNK